MMRTLVAALLLLTAPTVLAHHSYGDILREQPVTVSGVLEDIEFANPHVRLEVRADDGTMYHIEWGNLTQLTRTGVAKETLARGDRLVVIGSPHRDAAKHLVTLLTEIRRPADGWQWKRPW